LADVKSGQVIMKYITFTEQDGENRNTLTLPDEQWNALMGTMLHGCGAPPDMNPSGILCLTVRTDSPYEDGFATGA
jgi:hypothetical protein